MKRKEQKSRPTTGLLASMKKSPRVTILIFLGLLIGVIAITIISKFTAGGTGILSITYPFDKSIFPPEIIAPTIQ